MRISFFEEFPTVRNLEKAASLQFPSTVYLAAPSIDLFTDRKHILAEINPGVNAAYWPVLSKSYWVSPFCDAEELTLLREELKPPRGEFRVLIDLEIPVLSMWQIFRNFGHFRSNKKLIEAIISSTTDGVVTAEYPSLGDSTRRVLEKLGLSMPLAKFRHTKILMFYTTFIRSRGVQTTIKRYIVRLNKEYGGSIHVGLGTIAPGVFGTERILPARELADQLRFFRDEGILEVTLYRLGGLTTEYLDTLSEIAHS